MKRTTKLTLTTFEDRIVPATYGIPWVGHNVTVSFAPDGTQVDTGTSNLASSFAAAGLTTSQWQGEILRAFQSWSGPANLNFGVVSDSGAPEGAPGFTQGADNFGDIRVFARPLGAGVLAITAPPGNSAGTRAGDIVLNSTYLFGIGASGTPGTTTATYDLFSTLVHEAGHSLGLGDNPSDPTSAMYYLYQGTRTGPSAADFALLTGMYGVRVADRFDAAASNGSMATATQMPATGGTSTLYLTADLTAAAIPTTTSSRRRAG